MLCAISCSMDSDNRYPRDFLNVNYLSYFKSLDVDIDLLVVSNIFNFEAYFNRLGVKGIILSGGNNIEENNVRNTQEKRLLSYAIKNEIPLLGICRGMQFINHYFGGDTNAVKGHRNVLHNVNIISHAWLHETGTREIKTNSFHDYGVIKIPKVLEITCVADDGTVEALQHRELPIGGIQWHPERVGSDANDIALKILRNKI